MDREAVDTRADLLVSEGRTDDLLEAHAQAERDVRHAEAVARRAQDLLKQQPDLSRGAAVAQAVAEVVAAEQEASAISEAVKYLQERGYTCVPPPRPTPRSK